MSLNPQPYRGWLRYGTPDNPAMTVTTGQATAIVQGLLSGRLHAMSTPADDFEAKTAAALADLIDRANKVRRNLPAGHVCPDSSRCTNCAALAAIHLCLDDHCEQLADYRATRSLEGAF